jgi:hypothetical protein
MPLHCVLIDVGTPSRELYVSLCGFGGFKQPDEPRTLDFSNSQLARAAP